MELKVVERGKHKTVTIKEGEVYLNELYQTYS